MHQTPIAPGYHPLPPGHLANVVTCLEMTERPALRPVPAPEGLALQRMGGADTERFRSLFRAVGRDIMWFSRLFMEDGKLAAIIGDAKVECLALVSEGRDVGLLELDFREAGQCELTFFGLVPGLIGKGAGRFLMNEALTGPGRSRSRASGCIPAPSTIRRHFPSTSAPASGPTR